MKRKAIDRRKLSSLTREEQIYQLEKDWSENPRWENVTRPYSAKEVVDLEKSAYPVGGTPYRVDELGGTLEDYYRNKIPSSITGYKYADKGLPGHSRINVFQPYRGI